MVYPAEGIPDVKQDRYGCHENGEARCTSHFRADRCAHRRKGQRVHWFITDFLEFSHNLTLGCIIDSPGADRIGVLSKGLDNWIGIRSEFYEGALNLIGGGKFSSELNLQERAAGKVNAERDRGSKIYPVDDHEDYSR